MTEAQSFLAEIEAFLVRADMSASTFGRLTQGDHKLLPRLRAGGQVRLNTAGAIRRFMAEYEAKQRKRWAA